MLTRAPARPVATAAALACLATFALAGCSDQATESGDRPAASVTRATAPTEDPGATARSSAPATPSEPTTSSTPQSTQSTQSSQSTPDDGPAASPDASPGGSTGGPRTRLLAASEMPGFNKEFRWTEDTTRSREPSTPFGTCQRFAMMSIGATDVAVRTYRPVVSGTPDTAGELVAEFPDSTTARRAFAVLKSWRAKCADRLQRYDRSHVGELEDVNVGGGTGGWYLLTYGPLANDPSSQYFDAQGMAVVGSRIAMVEMILAGQDYNYEPGHEPMVAAVQRAAGKLS